MKNTNRLWYSLLAFACLLTACKEEEANPIPEQFNFTDFKTNYGLNLLGSAAIVTENVNTRNPDTMLVRLARFDGGSFEQLGGFWYGRSRVAVAQGFETSFHFKPSDLNSPRAFSFVVQNAGQDSLGIVGDISSPGFGYVAPSNSVIIGFSTRQQNIRIFSRKATSRSPFEPESETYLVPALTNVASGHEIKITYEPEGTFTIFLNNQEVAMAEDVNLEELIELHEGKAYVGFTAVTNFDNITGSYGPNHDILSWSFEPTQAE